MLPSFFLGVVLALAQPYTPPFFLLTYESGLNDQTAVERKIYPPIEPIIAPQPWYDWPPMEINPTRFESPPPAD